MSPARRHPACHGGGDGCQAAEDAERHAGRTEVVQDHLDAHGKRDDDEVRPIEQSSESLP